MPIYFIMNSIGDHIATTEFIKEAEEMAIECGGYYTTEWIEFEEEDY